MTDIQDKILEVTSKELSESSGQVPETSTKYMAQCLWCNKKVETTIVCDQDIIMVLAIHDECGQSIMLTKANEMIAKLKKRSHSHETGPPKS